MLKLLVTRGGYCTNSPDHTKPRLMAPRATRWLAAGLVVAAFAVPTQAFAACAGAVGINNDGIDINGNGVPDYLVGNLPATVNWTLTPAAGLGSDPIDVDQVRFGLSCFDNGDEVPCANGNDAIPGTPPQPTPLQFVSLTGGTCGASLNSNADGVVLFDLPDAVLTQAGCTITFSTQLLDYGTDSSPEFVNTAVAFNGTCPGAQQGSAAGSDSIEIVDPSIDIIKRVWDPTIPDWVDANSPPGPSYPVGSVVSYQLEVCNDGDLDLDDVIVEDGDLGIGPISIGPLAAGDCTTLEEGQLTGLDSSLACEEPGPFLNTAFATGDYGGGTVEDDDPANVVCLEPSIEVTKDGPPLAKAGDDIEYEICVTNTGDVALENCTGDDTVLGDLGAFDAPLVEGPPVCRTIPWTIPADEARDPIDNVATITCEVVGAESTVEADDDHSVNLFQPGILVTKTGPGEAKAGDSIEYEICVTNDSSEDTPALTGCVIDDELLSLEGDPIDAPAWAEVPVPVCETHSYTIPAEAEGSVMNEATVTCNVTGFDNTPDGTDDHTVTLYTVGAELTKQCSPDPVAPGGIITWDITVNNTGTKDITCEVLDEKAGIWPDPVVLEVPAGGSASVDPAPSREVLPEDAPAILNTATASCTPDDVEVDNIIEPLEASDECAVPVENLICRTPGFWGTHAGEEKVGRSTNLTQEVINAAGGSLGTICGREINNTFFDEVGDDPSEFNSAVEAICVHPKGTQQRQLLRQLTAAALNCVISGGAPNCLGVPTIYDEFTAANEACTSGEGNLSYHIGVIDDFNNGVGAAEGCHDRNLKESDVFADVEYKVPGPAGSSRACNTAIKNETYLVPILNP